MKVTGLNTSNTAEFIKKMDTYIPGLGGTFFTSEGKSAPNDVDSGVPLCTGTCYVEASAKTVVLTNLDLTPSVTGLIRLPAQGVLPNGNLLATAHIDHAVSPGGLTNDTLTTVLSFFTVKDDLKNEPLFNSPALIELRRDASTIRTNKIDRAAIYYAHEGEPPVDQAHSLPNCSDVTVYADGNGPSSANPVCIFTRTAFTKKNAPTADDLGDHRFVIKALENGGFKF